MTEFDRLSTALLNAVWHVRFHEPPLPEPIPPALSRYPAIPGSYRVFLSRVAHLSNPTETAWFHCHQDFLDISETGNAFHWNEWERLSLEAAGDDPIQCRLVVDFWDRHLPIASSVRSDYAFLALRVGNGDDGKVVYGYGPDFEDSSLVVADGFPEYLDGFLSLISKQIPKNESELCFGDFL